VAAHISQFATLNKPESHFRSIQPTTFLGKNFCRIKFSSIYIGFSWVDFYLIDFSLTNYGC
jgi:hypothetical protein